MSFGYAIGDFVLLTQLAWDVVQNSRKACGAHDELTSEVTSLHIVLRRLEIEVSKPNSILTRSDDGTDRREELAQLSEDCKRVLRILDGILKKYNALSEEKRSVTKLWKKVQFGNGEMLDLAELRIKLITSTSALTLFLNLLSIGSQGKVESYMESQGDELKEMRISLNWITASMQAKTPKAGEGSILTTYAGDDKAIWKEFRRGLIQEGFSSEVLERHMETIKGYVIELGNRGALDDIEDGTEVERLSLKHIVHNDELDSTDEESELDNSASRPQDVPESNSEHELVGNSDPTSEAQTREQTSKQQKEPMARNDQNKMQSSTEPRNLDEGFESNDDETGGKGRGSQADKSQYCFEEPTNITLKPADEHTFTDMDQNYTGVDLQTSNNLQPIYQNPESPTHSSARVNIRVNNVEVPTAFTTWYHPPPTIDIRRFPNLIYESGYFGREVRFAQRWFGPYLPNETWSSLGVRTKTALFTDQKGPNEISYEYKPHAICYWMFILARAYESIRSQDNLSTPPKILSPLADELQLLVGRACAYYNRISVLGIAQQKDQYEYISRFLPVLETLYLFIRGGLCYMLGWKENKARETVWMFDESLIWRQEKDEFCTTQTPGRDTQNVRPIFALDPKAGIEFLQGVFRDGHIVHSLDGFNTTSSLAELVNCLQFLLLFFKSCCEDDLLEEEAKWTRFPDYRSFLADEILDTEIADADYELRKCKTALVVWKFDNTCSAIEDRTERFATKTASLSTILERCDEAQFRLHQARLRLRESRLRPSADRARTTKRRNKKKK